MAFGQHDHPFYRQLWRRVAIVVVAAAWAAMELYARDGFWTVIAVAVLAYSVWAFLIIYPKPDAASGSTADKP